MLTLPFFRELEKTNNILLAGAGGGFDIFCGLPLYFALKNAGKQVHLANMSFSDLENSTGNKHHKALVEITSETEGNLDYFPELHLARWFAARGENVPIYCFTHTGAKPIFEAYQKLVEMLNVDTIILVDGGSDSLMRGDEITLSTPNEEAVSIAAVDQLAVPYKYLACLGFGIDDVCHAHFLEAVAAITKAGGFLGAWTLTKEMPEVQLYREATEAVFEAMPESPSVISASILSAIDGQFGDYHATYRTMGSKLFINSLMTLYWCFTVEQVARRNLYLDKIRDTETYRDLATAIKQFHASQKDNLRPWVNLPM